MHTNEAYVKLAREMQAMGVSTICIKDMAGIMTPKEAYELVSALKDAIDLPVVVHTHSTTGTAFMTYLKAVEAGADVIDTAISSFSGGTAQPATETLQYVLREYGYETGLNDEKLKEINRYFKAYRTKCLANGTLNPIVMATDTDALTYQIPGGMLSNLVAQLTAQDKLDELTELIEEQGKNAKFKPRVMTYNDMTQDPTPIEKPAEEDQEPVNPGVEETLPDAEFEAVEDAAAEEPVADEPTDETPADDAPVDEPSAEEPEDKEDEQE